MIDFLRNVPFFADLAQRDLDRLVQVTEVVRLPAETELFAEGMAGDRAYVVKEGQIEILKSAPEGDVQLAVHGPGGMIGEMSLLHDLPRNATAREVDPLGPFDLAIQISGSRSKVR